MKVFKIIFKIMKAVLKLLFMIVIIFFLAMKKAAEHVQKGEIMTASRTMTMRRTNSTCSR